MKGSDRWFFIFLLGILLFNWPFLTIFEDSLPSALFGLWVLFIGIAAIFIFRESRGGSR